MRKNNKDKKSNNKLITTDNAAEVLNTVGFDLMGEWTEAIKSKDMKKAVTLSKLFPFVFQKVPKYGFSDTEVFKDKVCKVTTNDMGEYLDAVISYREGIDLSIDQDHLGCKFRCLNCKLYLVSGHNAENVEGRVCPSCLTFFSEDDIDAARDQTKSAFIKAWLEKKPTTK